MPYKQNVRKNNFTDNYDYQLIQPNIPGRANIQAEVVDEKVQNWSYVRLFSDALHTITSLHFLQVFGMVFTQKINEVEWKQWQSYNNPPQLFYERMFSFNLLITNRHLWQQEPSVTVVEQLATTSYKTCWDWLQKNLLFALVPTKMLTVANWMVVSPYPPLRICSV